MHQTQDVAIAPTERPASPQTGALPDLELAKRARARDEAAVRELMRRYNQRLFRIARGLLRDNAEAEDAVQDAWIRAFTHLDSFRGDAALSTWLVRIAMNEALGRLRRRRDASSDIPEQSTHDTPETVMANEQLREALERAIDNLPDAFRSIFVARMVEGLSVDETAELFGVKAETVKTRVHRARARLRADLQREFAPALTGVFGFEGARCNRLTEAVVSRLRSL